MCATRIRLKMNTTTNENKPAGISVFFPAFNDENTIGALVANALNVLQQLTDDYEVIVVNDGSADNTAEVLSSLERLHKDKMRVVTHEKNKGYGAALRSGFNAAGKELIFYTDGDGQYDVKELLKLYPLMTQDVDVVNGYKIERADKLNRKVIGGSYNRLAHFLFRLPIRDVDCDFRLLRSTAIEKIELKSSSGSICVELVYKLKRAGCRFVETPVHHYPRLHGQSQFFTFGRVARTLRDFFRLWLKLVVLNSLASKNKFPK